MNANPKSTREDPLAGKAEGPEMFVTTFAGIFHRGLERYVDLQKTTLDAVHNQALDATHVYRNTLRNVPAFPGMILLDIAEQAMGKFVEAEKNILDVMVNQSAHVVELTKERTNSVSKATEMAKDLFRDTTERGVAVQKMVLDLAAEQTRVVTQTVKRQTGFAGTPLATAAENIEKGVNTAVETQKEILEAAVKPLKASAKA